MSPQDLQQIQSIVAGAKKVLVLTHKDPSLDVMASALSLYLASIKVGKEAVVAMEIGPIVELGSLVGIDRVQTELSTTAGGKNLVITLNNYPAGAVDKVSCAEDLPGGKFNLTLVPKDGAVLNSNDVTFSSSGGAVDFDLVYTVELMTPDQAGRLYDPELFKRAQIINVDDHDANKDYGKFNLVEPEAASVSEIVTFYLRALGVQFDADIAGNLLKGLQSATSNFARKATPATHEAAAICLRAMQPPKPAVPIQPAPVATSNGTVPTDWTGPKIYRGGGATTI